MKSLLLFDGNILSNSGSAFVNSFLHWILVQRLFKWMEMSFCFKTAFEFNKILLTIPWTRGKQQLENGPLTLRLLSPLSELIRLSEDCLASSRDRFSFPIVEAKVCL